MENNDQISGASATPLPPPYYASYVPRNKKPEYFEFKSRVTSSKGLTISLLSIILCILFLETIFFQSPGIAAPIYLAAFYCSIYYFFRENDTPLNRAAVILTIPAMLMAVSFFIHYNPSTRWITWLTLIGIICIQLILLGNFQINSLFSPDTLVKVISNLFAKPFTNLPMPFYSFGILKNKKSATTKNVLYALIGIIVAIPVAAILMGLFVQADAVFAASVRSFKNFIGLDFDRITIELFLGLPSGVFLGAALLGLKYEKHKEKTVKNLGSCIEPVITGTFLTIINMFLIAFVGFQFMYLFGGLDNIKTSGISYAEYARRGFFELCTASAIIFAIALFVIIMTKKKNEKLSIWISLGTVVLCAGDGILLISAVKRMFMYISAYGLSIKRVLTLWLMAVIGLCLLWMIIKCFKIRLDVTKWIGITVIVGVCILSLANIEKIIAEYNVDSYLKNPDEPSVIFYLNQLSYTAAPQLEKLWDLPTHQKTEINFNEIVENKKLQLSVRNKLYGFTLDSIEASKVLSRSK
ncbi:DUF4173 domain-containing protein [Clostridium sp. BNL1100]|uniref:DUF4153 domain-containing protein n=1 Tax=Clostridium sp. BNL1100 TaxID=755731 RepID=UPI00024A71FF|nr:DUF4173 domain-containing protein [Clostridium sp. BNL1100]AEY68123.1 hypothetical protein Clo1100_4018 [Clostridium sp. BNL1100]